VNKDFLIVKQKFIETLLGRYSFWDSLVSHQIQTWTDNGAESRHSLITGKPELIRLSALEHLAIAPLVFDYLDVTISLRFGLSDEPFKTKLKILREKAGEDLTSQLIIAIYDNLSSIRNKLLHQKGSLSECGKIIITKGVLSVELNHFGTLNSLASMLGRIVKNENKLCLNDKSVIWSSYKIIFPEAASSILEAASFERVVDINVSIMRYKIDMRSKAIVCFEDLKKHLYNRFVNEDGKLIGNTDFLFKYEGDEYSMPAEYLYKNKDIKKNDIRIWATEKHT